MRVLASELDSLQVEIADRQNDAPACSPGPHTRLRGALSGAWGPRGHEQGELQRQQPGPRQMAHGLRATAPQLGGGGGGGAGRAAGRAGAHPGRASPAARGSAPGSHSAGRRGPARRRGCWRGRGAAMDSALLLQAQPAARV